MIRVRSPICQNWGKTHTWCPKEVLYPKDLTDLRKIILDATATHTKIRIAGSLHSMNELNVTSGILISTDKLQRVLSIDTQGLTVRVEGGIKMKNLLSSLAKENLTLANQGYIAEQSIAGIIATATHGSGHTGTISSFVKQIELLDGRGELHILTPEKDFHLFSAAVVSLGCLGIIYAVTLECIPLERMTATKTRLLTKEVLENHLNYLENNDHFQFAINPYGDDTLAWFYNNTQKPLKRRWFYCLHRLLVIAVMKIKNVLPTFQFLIPYETKFYMRLMPLKECVDYSYRLLSPADEPDYIEAEYAVPRQNLIPALAKVREIIQSYREHGIKIISVVVIRFAEKDPYGYLSPAFEGPVAYISLITMPEKGYPTLFRDVETALYEFTARPHWGKVNFLTKERIKALYRGNYEKFVEAQHQLDPDRIFCNAYLESLFDFSQAGKEQ